MTLAELIDAKQSGLISHTRAGDRLYRGTILVYRHDSTSPSMVRLLGVVADTPEATAILRGSLSPLSPTEAR